MANNRRIERLEEEIKKEASHVLMHVIDDFEDIFLTITRVTLSKDLVNATIYYSVLGDEEEKERTLELIKKNSSRIRFELGNRIDFRNVPLFYFKYDKNIEHADKINKLLNEEDK